MGNSGPGPILYVAVVAALLWAALLWGLILDATHQPPEQPWEPWDRGEDGSRRDGDER